MSKLNRILSGRLPRIVLPALVFPLFVFAMPLSALAATHSASHIVTGLTNPTAYGSTFSIL